MTAIIDAWHALQLLVVKTFKVWWQSLPGLVFTYTIGWLCYRLSLLTAALISGHAAWAALLIVSLGLVFLLGSIIVCFRLIGETIGLVEPFESENQGRRNSKIFELLIIAMVPFISIWSVFDGVNKAAQAIEIFQIAIHGVQFGSDTVLGTLNPRTQQQYIVMGFVMVASYVVSRIASWLSDHTRHRWLSLVEVILTAFGWLIAIYGGARVLFKVKRWVVSRVFVGWMEDIVSRIGAFLEQFGVPLPEIMVRLWKLISQTLWPAFTTGLVEPMLWLAMAGLAWGTQVLSVSDLWKQSSPAPLPRRALEELDQEPRYSFAAENRDVVLWFQQSFAAFLDEKILPMWQSFKLIIRSGGAFVAAYVLAWSIFRASKKAIYAGTTQFSSGRESRFWVGIDMLQDLFVGLTTELLRFCLLAVTFAVSLGVFGTAESYRDDDHDVHEIPAEKISQR